MVFLTETAVRNSGRNRIGAFLPDLFNVRYHSPWYLLILLCQLVHLYALLLGPANFELRFTIDSVSEKTIVNTFVMFILRVNSFAASLPRVEGKMVLFYSSVLPCRAPWQRPILITWCGIEHFLLDSFSTKNCPQVQYITP